MGKQTVAYLYVRNFKVTLKVCKLVFFTPAPTSGNRGDRSSLYPVN